MYGWDHGGWMLGGGGGWLMAGWLWMILVWLIPILLLLALVKYLFGNRQGAPWATTADKSALDIIKEAYAKGEISRDDYLRKRDDLLEK